jgi:hypothetical protein
MHITTCHDMPSTIIATTSAHHRHMTGTDSKHHIGTGVVISK